MVVYVKCGLVPQTVELLWGTRRAQQLSAVDRGYSERPIGKGMNVHIVYSDIPGEPDVLVVDDTDVGLCGFYRHQLSERWEGS